MKSIPESTYRNVYELLSSCKFNCADLSSASASGQNGDTSAVSVCFVLVVWD